MRLFVASFLDVAVRNALRPWVAELLAQAAGSLRAVPEDSEHFTHVFLGECDVEPAQLLNLMRSVADREPVKLRFDAPRWFPSASRPRLVMLPVAEGRAGVMDLTRDVRRALLPAFPNLTDERVKSPHVTLARVAHRRRRGAGVPTRSLDLSQLSEEAQAQEVAVGRVELVHSRLQRAPSDGGRPVYRVLGGVDLGGAAKLICRSATLG